MPINKERVNKYKREKIKRETEGKLLGFELAGPYKYIPYKLKKFCVPISQVSLLENNPRINDKAAEKLAILIKENGFRKPIVIDQDGKVRAGNTAYKAARILGLKFIPAAESDFTSEGAAMRFVISDNKASEFSYWDKDLLKELLENEELDLNGKRNIQGLGLTDADLKKLFEIKEEKERKPVIEVVVTVDSEEEAENLVNHLQMHDYKCRVLLP